MSHSCLCRVCLNGPNRKYYINVSRRDVAYRCLGSHLQFTWHHPSCVHLFRELFRSDLPLVPHRPTCYFWPEPLIVASALGYAGSSDLSCVGPLSRPGRFK
ncbi:hypothetical protein B0H17DRAFT_432217 [Mycena rosella]|uniref:Uncharacterized protein n=1 Tax=Mycena rosella TaxID=1033263 RepID=A0AAD7GM11_MYCRO|nr:hypothetical protein B0H17DRAFT_432217 [Mycena rosella]